MSDQNEEKYRQKVREVLADGRMTDLEDTTLGFYQHTLKISDETAMRIFDEVLKEVTAEAEEQPSAVDESGSALKKDEPPKTQQIEKQSIDKESAERITYQSWDEFEKAQYHKGALYKEFMPIARQFHDMLISTFQGENKPVEPRYGESTFSFSVPRDLVKSRKRTFASFGMLNLVTQKCYIQNLYKEADDELPEGSRLYKKSDPTVYVYSFGSMSDFECVKQALKACIIRSYELLSSASSSRKSLKEESKISVNTSESIKSQNDVDIDARDEDCKTALIRAAEEGDTETVELLLDREADIEAKDNEGKTALIVAASEGHTETVGLLLDKGADIEADEEDGWRALHFAASDGHTETVQLLLDKGANIEAITNKGVTPLFLAAVNGQLECVKMLIGAGAKVNVKNNEGKTVFIRAEEQGHAEIVKYLNEHNSNSKEKAEKGNSEFLSTPEYPGEFYFLTEKYSTKLLHIKNFYRLSRGEELFRKLSVSEVDSIIKKIRTTKIIPKLTFAREILEDKYEIPVKDAPFWFMPFAILAEQIGCFLYIERNGIYANHKKSKEIDACFSWESATDVSFIHGFPELEDNSDDDLKMSFSITSDADEEYPDPEETVSTLVLKTDDGHLTINEFHGDKFGSQLLIVKTIWNLWKIVVDQSRNSDVWPQNDEVPNGPQYRYFDSWDALIAWAEDTSTDQSQNDTRVNEKRKDSDINVVDQNFELYRRKVMDVLADGVVSDLERTGLDFYQHKLKLTDEDALRIFDEVLAEMLEKAGEKKS